MSDQLAHTAKAIHTLFYATAAADERYRALRAALTTDAELAAFQALGIGLIDFEPLDPLTVAGIMARPEPPDDTEGSERLSGPTQRVEIEAQSTPEAEYAKRLLEKMYGRWKGTLKYEPGRHRLVFYSPFDEQGRRHTLWVKVSVDGYCPDMTVRSYVLGPYLLVKDERTGRESDKPWHVLEGDLTPILPESVSGWHPDYVESDPKGGQ